jgi:hypothetical protein
MAAMNILYNRLFGSLIGFFENRCLLDELESATVQYWPAFLIPQNW